MDLETIPTDAPVLIVGPTASGKSALAMKISDAGGGTIVNADALQVYSNWRILTARPSAEEEAAFPHALYGHIGPNDPYSVGHWLREVGRILSDGSRPIIVGGTGLYLSSLTEGLADIPETPPDMRSQGDALALPDLIKALDPQTASRIDLQNRARVQRAWEVLKATGRPLAAWQEETSPPLLPLENCIALRVDADKDWLSERIERRFDLMIEEGALDEVRANLEAFDATRPACRAIGAPELVAHLNGDCTLGEARTAAIISTRRYAKRQRTWMRARMKSWQSLAYP